MKTSKYILLAFLIFIFGSIAVFYIDAHLNEDEFLAQKEEKSRMRQLKYSFNTTLNNFKADNANPEKWNAFLTAAKHYLNARETSFLYNKSMPYNSMFVEDVNTICWNIYLSGKKMNTPDATAMGVEWAKKAVQEKPEDPHMNETYANLLFEMGLVAEAVKYQQKATDILKKQGHQWTDMYQERLERFKAHLSDTDVKTGSHYPNVNPTNLDGETVQLSTVIEGKTALLVFWATWAPYSIEKQRELIPIYNQFKNKGLTVVGIAGEFKFTKKMRETIENEQIPWINLVDLDRTDRVWDKYGVLNTGYKTFLIDKNGTVAAINPTVAELEATLKNMLK